MTTIFTLPLLNFPRKDPSTGKSDPSGQLEGSYVFGIVGEHPLPLSPSTQLISHSRRNHHSRHPTHHRRFQSQEPRVLLEKIQDVAE